MSKKQQTGAIIVAAGSSQRMAGVDKVFALLGGKPMLGRVVDVLQECCAIDRIVIVLSERNLEKGSRLVAEHGWSKVSDICLGGRRRQDSVVVGLSRLKNCYWVLIHDGARPLLTESLIKQGLEAARETGAAVAALPVSDTIKIAGADRFVQRTPLRKTLWAAQTPQVFRFDIISEAYRQAKGKVTDDASLVERLGSKVKLYAGVNSNIKITTPDDLALAQILWHKYGK